MLRRIREAPNHPWSFLIVRTDRVGDAVLTLPTLENLHRHFPRAGLTLLASPANRPVFENIPWVNEVLTTEAGEGILSLVRRLRSRKFHLALVVHGTSAHQLALFLAGIPVKMGRGFNPGMIFLNYPRFQKRSFNQRHEMDYNLELLRPLISHPTPIHPRLFLNGHEHQIAARWRAHFSGKIRVAIQPFSRGSAPNLSPESYAQLFRWFTESSEFQPFVSGSALEIDAFSGHGLGVPPPPPGIAIRTLRDLMAFLSAMDLFIGSSTGPLHLAAALGVPVIGLFSRRPGLSARRWGPRGPAPMTILSPHRWDLCPTCGVEVCSHRNAFDGLWRGGEIQREIRRAVDYSSSFGE